MDPDTRLDKIGRGSFVVVSIGMYKGFNIHAITSCVFLEAAVIFASPGLFPAGCRTPWLTIWVHLWMQQRQLAMCMVVSCRSEIGKATPPKAEVHAHFQNVSQAKTLGALACD